MSRLPSLGPARLAQPFDPVRRRRLRWALVRRRRALGLAAALLAAAWVVRTLAPAPPASPPTAQVWVSTRPVAAGTLLGDGDLRLETVPAPLVPAAALKASTGSPAGRRTAGAVGAGEMLTDARLLGRGLLAEQPAGTRAVAVRPADPAVLQVLAPGDAVDVLRSPSSTATSADAGWDGASATPPAAAPRAATGDGGPVVENVRVLALLPATGSTGAGGPLGAGDQATVSDALLLAVSPSGERALASVSGDALLVVLR